MSLKNQPYTDALIQEKVQFQACLVTEFFYALALLSTETVEIHKDWVQSALTALPEEFHELQRQISAGPITWIMLLDAIPTAAFEKSDDTFLDDLSQVSIEHFQHSCLSSVLHSSEIAAQLQSGAYSLPTSLNHVTEEKTEWLMHLGLYPYNGDNPVAKCLQRLIQNPRKFRTDAMAAAKLFWKHVFEDTWQTLQSELVKYRDEKERLLVATGFQEFCKSNRLRVEVDYESGFIAAIRGGFKQPMEMIKQCTITPSAFNFQHYWHAPTDAEGNAYILFPFFEPMIGLHAGRITVEDMDPAITNQDPLLIFKALGDAKRFAIASLLAKRPMSSSELCEHLTLSKATISHHVHLLREAGLIEEDFQKGAVLLSLHRQTIEALSAIALREFYR